MNLNMYFDIFKETPKFLLVWPIFMNTAKLFHELFQNTSFHSTVFPIIKIREMNTCLK